MQNINRKFDSVRLPRSLHRVVAFGVIKTAKISNRSYRLDIELKLPLNLPSLQHLYGTVEWIGYCCENGNGIRKIRNKSCKD